MPKYMLIMRSNQQAVDAYQELDFAQVIDAMGKYNESMIEGGVLAAGEGLADAAEGAVVTFGGEKPIITDGPYGEVHELFNGFWIVDVSSKEEALEWAARAPLGAGSKLEVRRVNDASDFADFSDNEYIQKEKQWRKDLGTE
jgi:hypothetical protein